MGHCVSFMLSFFHLGLLQIVLMCNLVEDFIFIHLFVCSCEYLSYV